MSQYHSIKELVIETCMAEGGFPSYEKLTSLVKRHFPTSKWKETHYAWYKSKIRTGQIVVPGVSGEVPEEGDAEGAEGEIEESIESSLSLERDLHSHFAAKVQEIEPGLTLVDNGVEYPTDAGRIDLLARDTDRRLVVIELKAGKAKDNALGQLLGYMGCLATSERNAGTAIRGILVASGFDDRVIYATRALPSVKLVKYQLSFILQEVT
jgi:endonuclease